MFKTICFKHLNFVQKTAITWTVGEQPIDYFQPYIIEVCVPKPLPLLLCQ
jgi:hypothetical protein